MSGSPTLDSKLAARLQRSSGADAEPSRRDSANRESRVRRRRCNPVPKRHGTAGIHGNPGTLRICNSQIQGVVLDSNSTLPAGCSVPRAAGPNTRLDRESQFKHQFCRENGLTEGIESLYRYQKSQAIAVTYDHSSRYRIPRSAFVISRRTATDHRHGIARVSKALANDVLIFFGESARFHHTPLSRPLLERLRREGSRERRPFTAWPGLSTSRVIHMASLVEL